MGENARFKNGHARVEFENTSESKWVLDLFSNGRLLSNGRQRVVAL